MNRIDPTAVTRRDRWSGDDILATPGTQDYAIIQVDQRTRLTDPKSRFSGKVVEHIPGESVVLVNAVEQLIDFVTFGTEG